MTIGKDEKSLLNLAVCSRGTYHLPKSTATDPPWNASVISTYTTPTVSYCGYFNSKGIPEWGGSLLSLLGYSSEKRNLLAFITAIQDMIRTVPDIVQIAAPLHNMIVAATPHYIYRKAIFTAVNSSLFIGQKKGKSPNNKGL